MSGETQAVKTSIVDGIAVVTLSVPETRNALTENLQRALLQSVLSLEQREDIRALIVTGAGEAFSAGGDLRLMAELPTMEPDQAAKRLRDIYQPFLRLLAFPSPTIAAINGPAVGGGLGIALLTDIRIAGTSATFSAPFGGIGLPPGMGLTVLLPEIIGHAGAMELLLTGKRIDASDALRMGLVSEVVADRELQASAHDYGKKLASQSRNVTDVVIRRLRGPLRRRVEEAIEQEVLSQSVAVRTADYRQWVRGLTESRDSG